ncbi:helix-turn-helix domain-containing protein [Nonomuraea sp. NPDC049655]|uniref:helix-turn-helix domain-containing protein n=1 Tax=Nonomuraea sp. NPDC049655 TaxID=3364355 RepID=UPI0037A403EA
MVKTPSWPVDRFRELIDHVLRETGLPQVQLAALVPMDQSQLSRWKSGSSKPKYESLQSLGEALVERYPHLGIGPEEMIASVYPREAVMDAALPSLEVDAAGTVDLGSLLAAPALPPDLGDVKDPSPAEAAMLRYLASMQEEIRQLNKKIDALTAERERDDLENGAPHQKGA